MNVIEWTLLHAVIALIPLWVLNWGGAKVLEGWKSFFFYGWFAATWTAEQLRLYA